MSHWIKHTDEVEGVFYVNPETRQNIQAYGDDSNYPQFKADLDAGLHTVEDYAPDLDAQKVADEKEWRDAELNDTDIIMIQANSGEMGRDKTAWKTYRQALRDYPESLNFPNGERPVSP
jgi:hypothetical protein